MPASGPLAAGAWADAAGWAAAANAATSAGSASRIRPVTAAGVRDSFTGVPGISIGPRSASSSTSRMSLLAISSLPSQASRGLTGPAGTSAARRISSHSSRGFWRKRASIASVTSSGKTSSARATVRPMAFTARWKK